MEHVDADGVHRIAWPCKRTPSARLFVALQEPQCILRVDASFVQLRGPLPQRVHLVYHCYCSCSGWSVTAAHHSTDLPETLIVMLGGLCEDLLDPSRRPTLILDKDQAS